MTREFNVWALIPARGGSKSIPLKNLALLGGRPLMDYCIAAAIKSQMFTKIICSTDNDKIYKRAETHGIDVYKRPAELGGDFTTIEEVIRFVFGNRNDNPELLAIVEPTSPFIRDSDVQGLVSKLSADKSAMSAQTISQPPHTHLAINQRVFKSHYVNFIDPNRKTITRKQDKPPTYIFGNLVICRLDNVLSGGNVFGEPSLGLEIDWPYSINIDSYDELVMGNALIAAGIVDIESLMCID